MPTNLPPEYFEVEERYRAAQSKPEKIATLEELIGTIPKHKGTDKLRADLRKKLSKLKSDAASHKSKSRQVSPFQIDKEGAGQAVVIGPANVGKSSLVAALTNATPDIAAYPYTTSQPLPGMMPIDNIQVQLIDTPPLSREYEQPQLLDLIRRADLMLLVVDLQAYPIQQYQDTLALLADHRIIPDHLRDRYAEMPRHKFIPLLVLVNKTDDETLDEDFEVLCELLGEPECPLAPVSAEQGRYFERMKQAIFDKLGIIRVYSKPPGTDHNPDQPFVLKQGSTVEDFAGKVHKDFVKQLKSARVWGSGVFDGQPVGRDYLLHDEDIIELRT